MNDVGNNSNSPVPGTSSWDQTGVLLLAFKRIDLIDAVILIVATYLIFGAAKSVYTE